jgi:hypothetical protein
MATPMGEVVVVKLKRSSTKWNRKRQSINEQLLSIRMSRFLAAEPTGNFTLPASNKADKPQTSTDESKISTSMRRKNGESGYLHPDAFFEADAWIMWRYPESATEMGHDLLKGGAANKICGYVNFFARFFVQSKNTDSCSALDKNADSVQGVADQHYYYEKNAASNPRLVC